MAVTSNPVELTPTRVDIVASESLAAGTYSVQNVGGSPFMYAERDAAVAEPNDILGFHLIAPFPSPISTFQADVVAGAAIYMWTRDGEQTIITYTQAQ